MSNNHFPTKSASSKLEDGHIIDVVVTGFDDKISIMINHDGRVGKFYYVPLVSSSVSHLSTFDQLSNDLETDLLPLPHLTPMPLLGGSNDSDVQGRLYASMIASLVSRQSPIENRIVLVGLGPSIGPKIDEDVSSDHRKQLLEIVRLVQECKVW